MKKYDYLIVHDNLATVVEYRKEGFGRYICNFEQAHIIKPRTRSFDGGLLILGYETLEFVSNSLHVSHLYNSYEVIVKKIIYNP